MKSQYLVLLLGIALSIIISSILQSVKSFIANLPVCTEWETVTVQVDYRSVPVNGYMFGANGMAFGVGTQQVYAPHEEQRNQCKTWEHR